MSRRATASRLDPAALVARDEPEGEPSERARRTSTGAIDQHGTRAPRMRESMSRPRWSVPSQCAAAASGRERRVVVLVGPNGAIHGASSASATHRRGWRARPAPGRIPGAGRARRAAGAARPALRSGRAGRPPGDPSTSRARGRGGSSARTGGVPSHACHSGADARVEQHVGEVAQDCVGTATKTATSAPASSTAMSLRGRRRASCARNPDRRRPSRRRRGRR